MPTTFKQLAGDFVSLFFPQTCAACNGHLVRGEDAICTSCLATMPRTLDELSPADNPVARVLWGRAKVEAAVACFTFVKGGSVQELIHNLKYNGRRDAGIAAGKLFGYDLKASGAFDMIDYVVPVPLHASRLLKRGYNQAACFGEGLAAALGAPLLENGLLRQSATETQTRKSRSERWENVEDVFVVNPKTDLTGKHILLVDDVITTGATTEACAAPLLALAGTRVSIAALASARE